VEVLYGQLVTAAAQDEMVIVSVVEYVDVTTTGVLLWVAVTGQTVV
jgi:hypothetical protein